MRPTSASQTFDPQFFNVFKVAAVIGQQGEIAAEGRCGNE
jgi:hypothetical protein